MEDQLKMMDELDRRFCIGDKVSGKILSIGRDEVVVSLVGYKSDGVIPFSELTTSENVEEAIKNLKVSDTITAKVIKLQNEDKNVVLSRLEYEKEEALNELENLFNNDEIFKLTVKEDKEKGLVAYYKGIRVFIPASQIDTRFIDNKAEFVGKEIDVKLIDFSAKNPSKVIASRRVILEKEQAIIENAIWDNISIGDIFKAEIKRFTKFGAFADVNGVDGLIHLSQISWSHVKSPEDVLKKGEIVDVKVIDMNREEKKLSLSIKALLQEPWANIEEKYPEGSIVLGKVVRINDFGAFVELEPGVDGLVHISKISHDRVNNPADILSIGQEIKAKILTVDAESKKIGLSMKDAE